MSIQIFWALTLYCWVIHFPRFEEIKCFHLQTQAVFVFETRTNGYLRDHAETFEKIPRTSDVTKRSLLLYLRLYVVRKGSPDVAIYWLVIKMSHF